MDKSCIFRLHIIVRLLLATKQSCECVKTCRHQKQEQNEQETDNIETSFEINCYLQLLLGSRFRSFAGCLSYDYAYCYVLRQPLPLLLLRVAAATVGLVCNIHMFHKQKDITIRKHVVGVLYYLTTIVYVVVCRCHPS